jgi:hypothetical protein
VNPMREPRRVNPCMNPCVNPCVTTHARGRTLARGRARTHARVGGGPPPSPARAFVRRCDGRDRTSERRRADGDAIAPRCRRGAAARLEAASALPRGGPTAAIATDAAAFRAHALQGSAALLEADLPRCQFECAPEDDADGLRAARERADAARAVARRMLARAALCELPIPVCALRHPRRSARGAGRARPQDTCELPRPRRAKSRTRRLRSLRARHPVARLGCARAGRRSCARREVDAGRSLRAA